jgi:hypothetical protein
MLVALMLNSVLADAAPSVEAEDTDPESAGAPVELPPDSGRAAVSGLGVRAAIGLPGEASFLLVPWHGRYSHGGVGWSVAVSPGAALPLNGNRAVFLVDADACMSLHLFGIQTFAQARRSLGGSDVWGGRVGLGAYYGLDRMANLMVRVGGGVDVLEAVRPVVTVEVGLNVGVPLIVRDVHGR